MRTSQGRCDMAAEHLAANCKGPIGMFIGFCEYMESLGITPEKLQTLRAEAWAHEDGEPGAEGSLDPLTLKIERLESELKEWWDYWGCESPHDTHVQAGIIDPNSPWKQLGIEQARANRLQHEIERLAKTALPLGSSSDTGTITTDRWRVSQRVKLKSAHAQSVVILPPLSKLTGRRPHCEIP